MTATATGLLREEHQLILMVARALQHILDATTSTETADFDALDDTVGFLRLFADACHHGKEEDLLFRELVGQGMPEHQGPIAVMLHEHRLGRDFVRRMGEGLERARKGDEEALGEVVSAGRGYIELIRNHIFKENEILFNIADAMVTGPSCERLCASYDVVCARTFEGCTKAQLRDLAVSLSMRYPPGTASPEIRSTDTSGA